MEPLLTILGLTSLVLPGMWICNRIGFFRIHEWVPFSILFSTIFMGWVAYVTHFLTPLPIGWPVVLVGLSALLIHREQKKGKWKISTQITLTQADWIPLAWIGGLFCTLAAINLSFPFIAYDTLSYHLAFREWFAQPNLFPSFNPPTNVLESRANGFSLLYEAIGGTLQGFSPAALQMLPLLTGIIGISLLAYCFSREAGKPSRYVPLLALGSTVLLAQWLSDYVDLYFAFVFLGGLFLLTHTHSRPSHWFVGCFLIGSLIAIKLIAPLYWVGLIGIAWWYRSSLRGRIGSSILAFSAGIFPLLLQWGFQIPSLTSIGLQGAVTRGEGAIPVDVVANILLYAWSTFGQWMRLESYPLIGAACAILFFLFLVQRTKKIPIEWRWILLSVVPILYLLFQSLTSNPEGWNAGSLYRYTIPFFILSSVVVGMAIQRWVDQRTWKLAPVGMGIVIGIIFILPILIQASSYGFSRSTESTLMDRTLQMLNTHITKEDRVFFANTPNLLTRGYAHGPLEDASTYREYPPIDCSFLASRGVTRVVVFYPTLTRGITPHDNQIQQDATKGKCGKPLGIVPGWMTIYG